MIDNIEQAAIKEFGSFRKFCLETKQDPTNFKRKLTANLVKVQKWIEPLGLEIKIVLKNHKRVGKKQRE